jgi:hypothetical protein
MEKEKLYIERKASDNKYLHRDFFVTGDIGISYVGENYGDNAVKEYLTQYAKSFYKLIFKQVEQNGLKALEEDVKNVYAKEEWTEYLHTELTNNSLKIKVDIVLNRMINRHRSLICLVAFVLLINKKAKIVKNSLGFNLLSNCITFITDGYLFTVFCRASLRFGLQYHFIC